MVRDALKAVDRADIAFAIDCEQVRRSSPEIWKEILGDSDSEETGHIFNDLKLVVFQVQINQKFNLGIDIVCENTQSVQILSQQLQTICQQMLAQTKGKSFPSFSFQTEGTRLIVTLESELEEVMRMLEN